MTAAPIMKQIDQLIKLHTSLLQLAEKKTEAITHNHIEALEKLLNEEQAHVKAIGQVEKQRQEEVAGFLSRHPDAASSSMLDIMEYVPENEKQQLAARREELLAITSELKNKNNINQQLIYYSLQYINLTLDVLRPQDAAFNYSKPADAGAIRRPAKQSMFDSKA